jgi:hypothetical protein
VPVLDPQLVAPAFRPACRNRRKAFAVVRRAARLKAASTRFLGRSLALTGGRKARHSYLLTSPAAGTEPFFNQLPDLGLDLRVGPVGGNQPNPPRLPPRESSITRADTLLQTESLGLETSRFRTPVSVAVQCAAQGQARIKIENQRQVGPSASTDHAIDLADCSFAEAPAVALVGETRVIVAVTYHDFTAFERRAYDFREMLGSSGVHQHKLGHRSQNFSLP